MPLLRLLVRREGALEHVAHGVDGHPPLRDGHAALHLHAVAPVEEVDGGGPVAERDLGRLAVLLRVVFVSVGVAARHRVPGLHLLRHERAAVERREGVAFRLQQTAEVGGEAHGADGHAAVRLRGEDPAIGLVRVGRGVARGMLHHVLVGLHHVRVDVVDGMLPAERAEAQLPVRAHRDVGTAVVGVDDLDHADRRRAARGGDGAEDLALARVGERMERGKRAHVVEIRVHVGVEDDLLRRAERDPGGACGRHGKHSFHRFTPSFSGKAT